MQIFATIFAKLCCFVGQLVVGAILGLVYVIVAFKLIEWLDDRYMTLKDKWKSRKSGDAVPAK
jgi:hypothetical protein